jgi:hypothetical protein
MITAFGDYLLRYLKIWTDEIDESLSESELVEALQWRPATEALVLDQCPGN